MSFILHIIFGLIEINNGDESTNMAFACSHVWP